MLFVEDPTLIPNTIAMWKVTPDIFPYLVLSAFSSFIMLGYFIGRELDG